MVVWLSAPNTNAIISSSNLLHVALPPPLFLRPISYYYHHRELSET